VPFGRGRGLALTGYREIAPGAVYTQKANGDGRDHRGQLACDRGSVFFGVARMDDLEGTLETVYPYHPDVARGAPACIGHGRVIQENTLLTADVLLELDMRRRQLRPDMVWRVHISESGTCDALMVLVPRAHDSAATRGHIASVDAGQRCMRLARTLRETLMSPLTATDVPLHTPLIAEVDGTVQTVTLTTRGCLWPSIPADPMALLAPTATAWDGSPMHTWLWQAQLAGGRSSYALVCLDPAEMRWSVCVHSALAASYAATLEVEMPSDLSFNGDGSLLTWLRACPLALDERLDTAIYARWSTVLSQAAIGAAYNDAASRPMANNLLTRPLDLVLFALTWYKRPTPGPVE
jgi:hypothetical protein